MLILAYCPCRCSHWHRQWLFAYRCRLLYVRTTFRQGGPYFAGKNWTGGPLFTPDQLSRDRTQQVLPPPHSSLGFLSLIQTQTSSGRQFNSCSFTIRSKSASIVTHSLPHFLTRSRRRMDNGLPWGLALLEFRRPKLATVSLRLFVDIVYTTTGWLFIMCHSGVGYTELEGGIDLLCLTS